MNSLVFIDCLPPATETEILGLEFLINATLPEGIKSIYRNYNGGRPQPSFVHDMKRLYPINAFHSISQTVMFYNDFDDESLPQGFNKYDMLPFAYDPGSGIYSLSLRGSDFGTVYFYVLHEEAEIFGVWESFELFINSIVDDPDS